jgi:hypothetical protein
MMSGGHIRRSFRVERQIQNDLVIRQQVENHNLAHVA